MWLETKQATFMTDHFRTKIQFFMFFVGKIIVQKRNIHFAMATMFLFRISQKRGLM